VDFEVITEEEFETVAPEHPSIVVGANIPEQFGPMIQYDREMRCASRGCGSSTFLKLQGIPLCMTHCLKRMNEMLLALGVRE